MSSARGRTSERRGGNGRWSRRGRQEDPSQDDGSSSYFPPSLSESTATDADFYVTSPPKKTSGLTGSISTLFRRQGSKEPAKRNRSKGRSPRDSASPSSEMEDSSPATTSPNKGKKGANSTSPDGNGEGAPGNGRVSGPVGKKRTQSRLFYSSNADDESEDSFETRAVSQASRTASGTGAEDTSDPSAYHGAEGLRTILRYRGFSTSIQSLFLDEALVCASMGCFGLILSNRTEHLMQLRNDRRGVRWGRSTSRRTLPSRIVAYVLLLTLLLMATTFVIWGFGNGHSSAFADGFFDGFYDAGTAFDGDDDGAANGGDDDDEIAGDDDGANANVGDDDQYAGEDDDGNGNDDGDDAANNGGDDGDDGGVNNDDAALGDDGANQAQGDDGNNNNNNQDDDDGNNQDDAVANDDGGNNNYNDDGGGGNNGNNDDNNDDGNNGNDDVNGNDDGAAGDDYYDYQDDDRRHLQSYYDEHAHCPHRINGVFKIRDVNEGLWEPAIDFIKDEWYRDDKPKPNGVRALRFFGDDDIVIDEDELKSRRDLASDIRISLVLAFLVVLGILGRRRRMRTRYYLVRARAQEDHLFYASSGAGIKRVAFQDSREDQYEGACSHTLCGCYPTDPPMEGDEIDDEVRVGDDGVQQVKKKPRSDDCVSRGLSCIMGLCCGFCCKCWFQCLSVCALAQEAREMRLLVPTRFQRIDYITHQPFHEYQKELNDLRRGWLGKSRRKAGIVAHWSALSRLSRYILGIFISLVVTMVLTLSFNPLASFSWPDAIILIATFCQSFLVLYIVHWIFHKSDLSLDAVIKFFASGFVIAVPAAFFFEGVMLNSTLSTVYVTYSLGELISGEAFVAWVVEHWRIIWIVGELINAYIVAAVTEELCKYYTFRCVEHPDLIFLTGLGRFSEDERAVEGGMIKYPFGVHQVQKTNQRGSYDDEQSVYSRSSHRSRSYRSGGRTEAFTASVAPEEEFFEDEHDVRTHRQKAAAVTTGMISVAVGLACAENFLYVFLLGGALSGDEDDDGKNSLLEEWIVLLFRSIFPVHALAAAMQSISMIKKFVECEDANNDRIGVGRIILPAVIMHGTFDAVLLGINVYIETSWEIYLKENEGNADASRPPYNPLVVNGIAWLSISLVMILGIVWYYREYRNQRSRLIMLEEKEKAKEMANDSMPYASPSEFTEGATDGDVVL